MRTKKTLIVLISGKAGSGKTTLREVLSKKLDGLSILLYSFASPLKYMAKAYFGWTGEKDVPGRKLLQSIGFIGREYDVNVWCKHLLSYLKKYNSVLPPDIILVDDWRFLNEREFFSKNPLLDVVCIRVFGRGGLEGELANDISETELPEIPQDYAGEVPAIYEHILDNSGDLESLSSKADEIVSAIKNQFVVEQGDNK